MTNKKGIRSYLNEKEDKFSDVGSMRDGTDCSESSPNTPYKRKTKEMSKNYSVSSKNVTKSDAAHQPQDTFKILNTPTQPTRTDLPLSNKEAIKNRNNIAKKPTSCNRVKKKIVSSKRTVSSSYHKADSHAHEIRSKTPFLKSHLKSNKQNVARCVSLTDIREKEGDESASPSPILEDVFPFAPSRSEDFEKSIKSNGQNGYFDYIKEFDLIRNSSLFNQWGKSLWPSHQKDALISAPPTPKPLLLKRKTYSCGILSLNDPEDSSSEKDKNGVKEDLSEVLKYDTDESDICYLSENSDFDYNSGSEVSGNTKILETSSSHLNVKQPIRVKYVDENTAQNKELLIYSNDFLENVYKSKGRSRSKTEVFESVLEQSTIYQGTNLRVIPDIKDFFRNLKRHNKHKENTKNAQLSKRNAKETSKKETIQPERKVQSTPSRKENFVKAEATKKRKSTVLPLNNLGKFNHQKINLCDTNGFNTSELRKCFSPRNILNSRSDPKKSKNINGGDAKSESGGCSKSTTALKRINTEEIIASNFKHFFHFYAKLGGRLKSGVVISKMNSHFWLKKSGIIFDDPSFTMADDCFNAVARRKLVLNISDYMQYLSAIARKQRLFFVDVIKRLMNINLQTVTKPPNDLETSLPSGLQPTSRPQTPRQQRKMNGSFVKPPQKKV